MCNWRCATFNYCTHKCAFGAQRVNRNEKFKVLKFLPESFDDLLPNNVAVPLAKLWVVSDCEIVYDC